MEQLSKDQVEGFECRFAVHCPTPKDQHRDLHVVKQVIHTKDGHKIPHLRLVWDFKRSFYVTREGARNHQQKKEWEDLDKLQEYKTTQSNLAISIARAIKDFKQRPELRKLCRSPYVYGADILSTALIKHQYKTKWPELNTKFTVAAFDIETDVLHGTNEIIMATISFGDRVFTAIRESFLEGYADPIERMKKLANKYIGEYIEKRKIKMDVVIVKTDVDVILECFKKAHEWKPDFVAIWNITFDMNKMLDTLAKAGIDPKDVFSDPSIPPEYRFFKFKQGPKQKVTASGKVTPIKPAAQWHTVYCPSSFYFIDAMCAYRHIRTGSAEEPSYSLDNILNKVLGIRKLKFEEANRYSGIEWHQFMQEKYPLEYIVYNIFDCISMEELDETTTDLCLALPMLSRCSDFENFKSQPRRLVDDLHFEVLATKRVIATTSDEMETDDDDETTDLTGWIVTLPAHLVADNGLKIIEENPNMSTNIRGHVGD